MFEIVIIIQKSFWDGLGDEKTCFIKFLLKTKIDSLKYLKNNKDCDLKCYENVVAKCEELEYNILEMEKLL